MNRSSRLMQAASLILALLSGIGVSQAQPPGWRTFASRSGWRIQYHSDWSTGSCVSCKNTRAPDVYVDFFPPHNTASSGSVMVSPLQDKLSGPSVDAWLAEVAATDNLNPRTSEQRFTLNGIPALRVRYNAPGGIEMEAVYVVSGSRTFSIEFNGEKPGRLDTLPSYSVYTKMVESFKVQHP